MYECCRTVNERFLEILQQEQTGEIDANGEIHFIEPTAKENPCYVAEIGPPAADEIQQTIPA